MTVTVFDETQFAAGVVPNYLDFDRIHPWDRIHGDVPPKTPLIIHVADEHPYHRMDKNLDMVRRVVEKLVGRRDCMAIIIHSPMRVMPDTVEFYLSVPVSVKLCKLNGVEFQ